MAQIHFDADTETKKLLEDASSYLKINMSAFIRQSALKEARQILKDSHDGNNPQ